MPTKLSVFNGALAMLGQPLMSSDQDPGEDGETLRGLWDQVVEMCHEKTAWDFAKLRAECARLSETPIHGYTYYYALPNDCVRLLTVSESGAPNDEITAWEGEPGKIATDASRLYITYVSDQSMTQIGRWSTSFGRYVSTELAFLASPKINSSATEEIAKERRKAISDAIGLDAAQGPPRRRPHGAWASAARGNYRFRKQGYR
jgi:hypothetical protein